ncbi:CgeB family protein [Methylobrevis pamukkalensis]|uniref:Spore protein YkvP/CgeB glycosyl transferase-like domain-containing protein n=1 Tax=Methylobrevis pamukkalensis TaxID=1439726 RepID=A0A1E3H1A5_9HYPH|nr:glycosyltransferase [Methylobrevis pamukkalensis]ODN70109.1 hypothetical protein A6302_02588 [Methylobrevis pamukkalensis]
MSEPLSIVILGLSLSSAWGNGHATTYRALVAGLAADGHRVLFLERDVPWYAAHRDFTSSDDCRLAFYDGLDDLRRFLPEIRSANAVIVGSYVPEGREVIDLVLGARPALACFYDIDTPVTLAGLDAGETEFLAPAQIPPLDLYFSFAGGRSLRRLEEDFGARRALALYCSVDPARYASTGEAPVWDLGYLGTYSPDRQPKLEELMFEPARRCPQMRFIVAGARYPETTDWPANVAHVEHLAPEAHPSFYSRQRFTLNLTRADMVASGYAPSVRLFEAAACGTPVISDRWDGLDTLLPEDAIFTAASADEVVAVLSEVTEARRRAVADAARTRILAGHTGTARARELVTHLRAAMPAGTALRAARA